MDQDERVYYARRAQQERERGNQAEDNSGALVHLKMADEYERRSQGAPIRLHMST